ncbi:MAG: hypothetical protein Q8R49_05825, partial [Rhodoferax sp.]|nr:hypothetical protein [Rhodoferax sp.]
GKPQDYESVSSLFQVNHLEGYGLVERQAKGPILSVNAIKDHLLRAHRYEFEIDTNEKRAEEIGERSLALEIALRSLIRRALRATRTEVKATESVLNALPTERRDKLNPYSFKELLQDQDGPLFLLDLKNIISKEWDATFKNIFTVEKDRCMVYFDEINEMRRVSAHPKTIDKDSFNRWRSTINLIEKWIADLD